MLLVCHFHYKSLVLFWYVLMICFRYVLTNDIPITYQSHYPSTGDILHTYQKHTKNLVWV